MGYKRVIDRKMKYYGETDFDKKKIRVNPKKGELLNTIIHEEKHAKHKNKSEKWVVKAAKKQESNLTVSQAIGLLSKYKRKPKNRLSSVVY